MTPAAIKSLILQNAQRNFVVRLMAIGDAQGQLTNVKVVDASGAIPVSPGLPTAIAMTPPSGAHLKVRRMDFAVLGGVVQLAWESGDPVNPVPFAELQLADSRNIMRAGGISTLGVPNATGSILLSTFGFDTGSSFDITLECIKGVGMTSG